MPLESYWDDDYNNNFDYAIPSSIGADMQLTVAKNAAQYSCKYLLGLKMSLKMWSCGEETLAI